MASYSADQIEKLKYYSDRGDRSGYYTYLGSLGDRYAQLALGVVLNSTFAGAARVERALCTARRACGRQPWQS